MKKCNKHPELGTMHGIWNVPTWRGRPLASYVGKSNFTDEYSEWHKTRKEHNTLCES